MREFARIDLEDGGFILFEAVPGAGAVEGPVKAGRVGDAIRDIPSTLQAALVPVREVATTVLEQLRQAAPQEVEVEFGVDLATEAGAVITRSEFGCNLKVKLVWRRDSPPGAAETNPSAAG